MIGRDVFHKHPDDFSEDEWEQAKDFMALRLVEMDEAEEQRAALGV